MSGTVAAPPTSPRVPRVVGLDVARGLLMAYIVAVIHGGFWLELLPRPWGTWLLFEMPPVFIITGAAYHFSGIGRPRERYLHYLLNRGSRILLPYWAYALACASILVALGLPAVPTLLDWLNPVDAGEMQTRYMLNWHLWFVPVFLAVMALLPPLTRLNVAPRMPLLAWVAFGAGVVHVADLVDRTPRGLGQTTVFYLLWALFGVATAANPGRYRRRDYAAVLVTSIAVIASGILPGDGVNMQANKFPPNALFFLFSCLWSSLLLICALSVDKAHVAALSRSPLLRPFISAGYSIYLWQGIAYSAAAGLISDLFGRGPIAVLPVAIGFTVVLGLLAAPLERSRWRRAA